MHIREISTLSHLMTILHKPKTPITTGNIDENINAPWSALIVSTNLYVQTYWLDISVKNNKH